MSWIVPGYVSGNSCMELVDHIQMNGHSTDYENWKDEITRAARNVLSEMDERWCLGDCCKAIEELLTELGLRPRAAEHIAEEIVDDYFDNDSKFDIEEVVDEILSIDALLEQYQPDEEHHVLVTDDYEYQTSWLGGALNVFIPKSPWVTPCNMCSPCVPGSGDLDSACDEGEGNCEAYCPDPEDWEGWVVCRNIKTNEVIRAESK